MAEKKDLNEISENQNVGTDNSTFENSSDINTSNISENQTPSVPEKNSWWNNHKKKITGSAFFLALGVLALWLGYKKTKEVSTTLNNLPSENSSDNGVLTDETASVMITSENISSNIDEYEARIRPRSGHIRHLSESRNPSEGKIQEAAENGLDLGPHETYVNPTAQTYHYRKD